MASASTARSAAPDLLFRFLAGAVVWVTIAFLVNFALTFAVGWPGVPALFTHLGWLDGGASNPLAGGEVARGWVQLLVYVAPLAGLAVWVGTGRERTLVSDAAIYSAFAAYIVRVGFWTVFLIGIADTLVSFLRVEDFLPAIVGKELTTKLGLSKFRGRPSTFR